MPLFGRHRRDDVMVAEPPIAFVEPVVPIPSFEPILKNHFGTWFWDGSGKQILWYSAGNMLEGPELSFPVYESDNDYLTVMIKATRREYERLRRQKDEGGTIRT